MAKHRKVIAAQQIVINDKGATLRQRKLPPPRCIPSENDFYVTHKSDFQGQIKRIVKLFTEGKTEVNVHGAGKAILRTANLCLEVKKFLSDTVTLDVKTDSVCLLDLWEPSDADQLHYHKERQISALNIKISRIPFSTD